MSVVEKLVESMIIFVVYGGLAAVAAAIVAAACLWLVSRRGGLAHVASVAALVFILMTFWFWHFTRFKDSPLPDQIIAMEVRLGAVVWLALMVIMSVLFRFLHAASTRNRRSKEV